MVSTGNDSLEHYDDLTLEEYTLGQLLPEAEERIRQHLQVCGACRARVAELHHLQQDMANTLHHLLDDAAPGPDLSFDKIAAEWHKPPRRLNLAYRLQQVVPNAPLLTLVALLIVAVAVMLPVDGSSSLASLGVLDEYAGPPAVVAAATEEGLVVVRLSDMGSEVIIHLGHITHPRNIQFSADGAWLAFQQGDTLHVVNVYDPAQSYRMVVGETADLAWSGRTLAYTDGLGQLALFDAASAEQHVLVPADEGAWGLPVWSADGTQIAYAVVDPLPDAGAVQERQSIWRVDVQSGYRVELARNTDPEALLIPTAWAGNNRTLLAWDMNAGVTHDTPALYRVDVAGHQIVPVGGVSLARGARLAWPVSSQGMTLTMEQGRLTALDLNNGVRSVIPDQMLWPQDMQWAPNGAWMAYTVIGVAEGQGVYLYALDEAESRHIELPAGAVEKCVIWAGAEHLFVVRQSSDSGLLELWMVSLTTGDAPQRIMTNLRLPQSGPYMGWRWQDVLNTQMAG